MYYDDHRGMPRLAIFPAYVWCCARAITASCGSIALDLIVLRRPSPYSTIRNLTCPAMVTRAGHTNSYYCSTIFNTIVLRRPSLYSTTRNPSCSPMAVRADRTWYAHCHMTCKRLYYEDHRCVTPLKILRAPIW
mgnify:FL=1